MEDGSSQSFLGSLIKTLSSALSEQQEESLKQSEAQESSTIKAKSNHSILDNTAVAHDELDWMENPIEDQDMVDSMNIHKRILDLEINTIDKELDTIIKDKETVDYLVSLLKKRERLESQVHQLEDDIGVLQKEG